MHTQFRLRDMSLQERMTRLLNGLDLLAQHLESATEAVASGLAAPPDGSLEKQSRHEQGLHDLMLLGEEIELVRRAARQWQEDFEQRNLGLWERLAEVASLLHKLGGGWDLLLCEEDWEKPEYRERIFTRIREHLSGCETTLNRVVIELGEDLRRGMTGSSRSDA